VHATNAQSPTGDIKEMQSVITILLLSFVVSTAVFSGGCSGQDQASLNIPSGFGALHDPSKNADFLIFNGAGVDPSGSESIAQIIESKGLTQRTIDETEFNAMTTEEFLQYTTFVWPGGDSEEMISRISGSARHDLREAIVKGGLNYIGFCAGGFVAMSPEATIDLSEVENTTPSFGIAIVGGDYPENYNPRSGNLISMVSTRLWDGSTRDLVFWYGPYFNTTEGVIGRYAADNTPAMIQAKVNDAMIVLSGPHPEAPEDWQAYGRIKDSDGLDWDVAWKLIESAHTRTHLPTI